METTEKSENSANPPQSRRLHPREPGFQAGLVVICAVLALLPPPVNFFLWGILCFHFADRGWGGGLYSPIIKTSVALLPNIPANDPRRIDPSHWVKLARIQTPLALLTGIACLTLPLWPSLFCRIPMLILLATSTMEWMTGRNPLERFVK